MCSKSTITGAQIALLLFLLHTAWSVFAQAEQEAGVVIIVSGAFIAERTDGSTSSLQRRSKFFVGDVLRTSDDGKAQIRFRDGTILSLASSTELKVEAFRWSEDASAEEVANIVTLLKGGFRTITGAVSKRNRDAYRVNTPVATIGVRGTHYSVMLSGDLYVGVWEGGVTLKNDGGSLDLGLDVAYRYGQVGADQTLQGLMEPPPILMETMDPQPAGQGDMAKTDSEEESGDQSAAQSDAAPADDSNLSAEGELSTEFGGSELAAGTETTTSATVSTDQSLGQIVQPSLPTASDARLTDAELASLTKGGFLQFGGVGAIGNFGGKASDGGAGDPIFSDNGFYPGAAEYDTRIADAIVRRGSATSGSTSTFAPFGATMGVWGGTAATPIEVQTSATDPTLITSYGETAFWLTFDYTSLSVLQGLSGTTQYRNLVGYQVGTSHGNLTDFFMTTDVDFSNATVGGGMSIYTSGGDVWYVDYDGVIQGAVLNLSIDTVDSKVSTLSDGTLSVAGDIKMAFAGASGSGLAGYFDIQSTGAGPLHDVDGVFLLDNTAVGDRRLTPAEVTSIDRKGFAAIGGPMGGLFGGTASSGASGDPILVSSELDIDGNFPASVLRSGSATASAPTTLTFGSKQVEWGQWNADMTNPAEKFVSADDPLQKDLVMDKVYWLTVQPTDPSTLAGFASNNKTGTWTGTLSPSQFSGTNESGSPIMSLSFDATIQFNTGAVTGASMYATVSPDSWAVNFNNSTLSGGVLDLTANPTTSTVSGLALTDNTVSGGLRGAITGDAGDTIAASFSLRSNENPNLNLNGAFAAPGAITP